MTTEDNKTLNEGKISPDELFSAIDAVLGRETDRMVERDCSTVDKIVISIRKGYSRDDVSFNMENFGYYHAFDDEYEANGRVYLTYKKDNERDKETRRYVRRALDDVKKNDRRGWF